MRQRLPKLRNNKSRNRAFVEVHGKRIYLGPWGEPATDRAYADFIKDYSASGYRLPRRADELTVVELIARYWEWCKQRYVKDGKPTGEQGAIKSALRFLKAEFGHLEAHAFGAAKLNSARQVLLDKGLHHRTVSHYLGRIRRMFRWAVVRELYPADKLAGLDAIGGKGEVFFCETCSGEGTCDGCRKRAERKTHRAGIVTDEAFDAVLDHVAAPMDDVLRILRLTGMRPAEVTYMRPPDLTRGGDVWSYEVPRHKNQHRGKLRVVPIGPKAQAILAPYLLAMKQDARLFPIRRDSINNAVRRACAQSGIDRWVPKQLRSTRGQEVRDEHGLGTDTALLGHASTSTTERHYTSPDWKAAVEAARASG